MAENLKKYIYISAGEASGDLYGGHLIKALKEIDSKLKIKAMGGKLMEQMGADIIQPIDGLQLIGALEVIFKIYGALKVLRRIENILQESPPSIAILIDYPDFHFRLAKFLKKLNVPVIYFVSPQVWAWRSNRIKIIKKFVDLMIPLFEFEDVLFKKAGVPSIFLGHPLLDIVKIQKTKEEFLTLHRIFKRDFIIGIMPGSRAIEIKRHMNILINICKIIAQKSRSAGKEIFFYLIKAPALPKEIFYSHERKLNEMNIVVLEEDKYEAMSNADLLLIASGTATLEACILGTPMIVFYKVNWLSWLLGRWLIKVPYLCIVNIIANKLVVPEFYQGLFKASTVAEEVLKLMENPYLLEDQKEALRKVKAELGMCNASKAIASLILEKYWKC